MVKIYTSQAKQLKTINNNDNYFFENIAPKDLDDVSRSVMKKIDQAELIDSQIGKIQTPRGIGSIEDLSTGCKTVLNYLYAKNHDSSIEAINISYCGYNALDVLFDIVEEDKSNYIFVLLHRDEIYKCKEHDFEIDGKRNISSLLDL